MIVYKYDENGYYTTPHNCQPCPKTGGWLYPPRYLTSAPPEGEWKRAQLDGKKWALVDDNRGREIWNKTTAEYQRCETMDILSDYTTVKPPDEQYHIFDGTKWKVDSAKKAAYDEQVADTERNRIISERVWKNAEAELVAEGKITAKQNSVRRIGK
jgi:hypothetical protein